MAAGEQASYTTNPSPPSTRGTEGVPCESATQIQESGLKGAAGEYATGTAGSINQVDSVAVQSDKNSLQKGGG
jgi:hypothetical protein